jgi:hypothetical protein
VSRRLLPFLFLALLGLLFFAPLVLHPSQTLYGDHSDLLAQHIPLKRFLVHSWQTTGELPLWCPYNFGGTPFIHDIQVAAFYPPHFLLYVLPEERMGAALSWLVVGHVILAGWCMFAYAASQGLNGPASLVAAAGYMFAGKWMLHLLGGGHYITIGLAWLPLVLLLLGKAWRRRGLQALLWAAGAGGVFALVLLGTHPQWSFYAGLFCAAWTVGPALEGAGYFGGEGSRSWGRTAAALGRWLGIGTVAALVAIALAAVQLLPTLEGAAQATRGVSGIPAPPVTDTVLSLAGLTGTSLRGFPLVFGWDYRSGLGVLWIAAAALAPFLRRGRVRFWALVGLVLVVFSLGGGTLLQSLPGFRVFRLPSRMFLLAALPVALLAGVTTQAIGTAAWVAKGARRIRLAVLGATLGLALLSLGLEFLVARDYALAPGPYWLGLMITFPLAFWMFARTDAAVPSAAWLWTGLLLADLWTLAWPLVTVRPEAGIYEPSACVRFLLEQRTGPERLLVRSLPNSWEASNPLGAGLALVLGIPDLNGYNPLDVHRYKEYLQFIADLDQPLLPQERVSSFPVRNKPLLDLLGVRYLLQPSDSRLLPRGEEDIRVDRRWWPLFEDPYPCAFSCTVGGVQQLPPYTLYENLEVYPRAFVVSRAAPLPPRPAVLRCLKETDLRQTVLLEGDTGPEEVGNSTVAQTAQVQDYQPNRVVVEVGDGPGGWLVLADVWFPGWTCTIDGQPAQVYRADYLFRAVRLPNGAHEIVFTFDPASYRWGRLISVGSLAALLLLAAVSAGRTWRTALRGGLAAC